MAMAMAQEEGGKERLRRTCIDFLLQENYILTAFELLHELQEDGLVECATKLQLFFANSDMFPPEELAKMQALQGIDAVQLADEKERTAESAAVCEYELRLAREDIKSLQEKLARQSEVVAALSAPENGVEDVESNIEEPAIDNGNFRVLGAVQEKERLDIDCAVKEYLMAAGYKISGMTFQEEVNRNLDEWPKTVAHVPDALRRYYSAFLASTKEAVEERETLQQQKDLLLKEKEALEVEKLSFVRTLDSLRRDVKEREKQAQHMKESLDFSTRQLNECRLEVTSLKLELESLMARLASGNIPKAADESVVVQVDLSQSAPEAEMEKEAELKSEIGTTVSEDVVAEVIADDRLEEQQISDTCEEFSFVDDILAVLIECSNINQDSSRTKVPDDEVPDEEGNREDSQCVDDLNDPVASGKFQGREVQELATVQILADALPKIVPYVLINHREELLPLIMCAIERHPDSSVRDSLTHLLFNLIKRPDEEQRRLIMDACVELSNSVGQLRTETELLPQCWEQIDHKYEERRLLVAQSCGELGQLVGSEMRTSLILSIIEQLVGDQASVVREAAAHNLASLLPLFSNMDKYSKVEGLMFDLVCDPMGPVVDTSLMELVPAMVVWNKREKQPLTQLFRGILSRLLMAAQRCPPMSGVEGTPESQLRNLAERERWSIDVLLRLLTQLLPQVEEAAIVSYPLSKEGPDLAHDNSFFTEAVVKSYTGSNLNWPTFDWLVEDFFPTILQLARMLPPREESLRTRLCKVLLEINECFGNSYHTFVVLPIFRSANGDNIDDLYMSFKFVSRIKGLRPRTPVEERLATICVLPLFLSGVLGAPGMNKEELAIYLRELILQSSLKTGAITRTPELIDAVRFLWYALFGNKVNPIVVGLSG